MEENSVDLDISPSKCKMERGGYHIFDVSGFTIFSYQVKKIWWMDPLGTFSEKV